ncbi:hypothetical protein TH25_08470 [Thalassospira profundimaris]|uniref:Uncharacterized protein n=1 Tax=Thalassospira profundimaris TaxID=502049 RepID=A0A367XG07_9PROT|nr:hypothetical protein [Thalassospira profundimaris]RCK51701.1 hypothetical protein TH25_08470 [Thalassospira profundimaris]
MPILAPVAEGGAIALGGLSAAEVAVAGVAATAVVVSGLAVVDVIDDYLDTPASESEIDSVLSQAGDRSKAEQRRLRDCADCVWCMINIQAQGDYLPLRNRTDPQGVGPYLVNGRTVYVREGIIVAGATHEFAKDLANRSNFKQIERWDVLAKTIAYIQSQPPYGIPPSRDNRPGALDKYSRKVRYDINVFGTVNAFMA